MILKRWKQLTQSGLIRFVDPIFVLRFLEILISKSIERIQIFNNDFQFQLEDEEHGRGHKKKGANKENEAEGPTVDRMCPKCGFDKMSYATLQLRSADEGQTVFFTCLKCKFKESENS